jgi:hypothetical protein
MEGKMSKVKKDRAPLIKVRSKVNSDVYYTSSDFPQKDIEGKKFIGVKKTPTDKTLHYIVKDMVVKISNE